MRSSPSLTGLAATIVVATITACYSAAETSTPPPTKGGATPNNAETSSNVTGRACPERSPLTYQSFGAPFFLNYCTGCHSSKNAPENRKNAPPGVDFDSLEGIRKHAARIYARAGDHNATMPPAGGPSLEQRTQLGDWLACGAVGDEAPPVPPKPPTPPPPKDKPARECTERPQLLPAVVLPRCSVATWNCLANCQVTDPGCESRCIAADTTPPNTAFGTPFGCGQCIDYQQYACTDAEGCHDVVAPLECCQQDKCQNSTDPNCTVDKCASEVYAYGYCLGAVTPRCSSLVDGPARQCFPAQLGIGDAGAD